MGRLDALVVVRCSDFSRSLYNFLGLYGKFLQVHIVSLPPNFVTGLRCEKRTKLHRPDNVADQGLSDGVYLHPIQQHLTCTVQPKAHIA